jgi:hypothetical protein
MQLACTGLKNVETFSKSDPFLEICRVAEDGKVTPVFKTEVGGGQGGEQGMARVMKMHSSGAHSLSLSHTHTHAHTFLSSCRSLTTT